MECDELHVVKHGVVQVALFGLSTWMLVQALPLRAMARLVASVKFEPISVNWSSPVTLHGIVATEGPQNGRETVKGWVGGMRT